MVADRSHALHVPRWRDIAGMEEQGVADRRFFQILIDDFGNRDSGLPLFVRVRHAWQRMAVDERKLTSLEDHAAISTWEATAALGAVRKYLAHRQLAGKRLTL